jgi:clan AA aspartic protease
MKNRGASLVFCFSLFVFWACFLVFFCLILKKLSTMGLVHADIELINGDDWSDFRRKRIPESEVRRMTVNMNVDSGALMMAINENIQGQLGLEIVEVRRAQLADGTFIELPVTSPIEVRFANRRCTTQAVVLPGSTQPLLGAIPMEDMDVLIHPAKQELVVHPDHPYLAQFAMRGFR